MVGTGGDALEQTRGRGRVGGDALWLRCVGVDALVGARWRRRVWLRRVGVDALKQTRGRRMCLDFSKMNRAFSRIKFPFQMSHKYNF